MKLKTILITLGILLLLFLAFKTFTAYVGKKIKGSMQELVNGGHREFLEDIDFSEGGYAVIIEENNSAYLVKDKEILKANTFKINKSLKRFLPAEGLHTTGIYLFKDAQLQKSDVSRRPRKFEVGSLRDHAVPVDFAGINEPRTVYLRKKDSIESSKNVFVINAADVDSEGLEYNFILNSPAILISNKDKDFSLELYGEKLRKRLNETLAGYSGFSIGTDTYSDYSVPSLILTQNGSMQELRDSKTGEFLSLNDHILHEPSVSFSCTHEFYEQLQTHDFSEAFIREGLLEDEIKALIQRKLSSANNEITNEAIYNEMFTPKFRFNTLKEKRYQLRYFKLVNDSKVY